LPGRLLSYLVEPQFREASVSQERTFVGLGCARLVGDRAELDGVTGEVWQRKLFPHSAATLAWVSGMPGLVAVAYEADPTGFGVARFLRADGVRGVVAAASKLQRPSEDRGKKGP